MSKLSYDGLKTFKEKNDETYIGKDEVIDVNSLNEETEVDDDDIIIKGKPETGDLVRIKASDFFSKVEDEIGDINSALSALPQIQYGALSLGTVAANAVTTVRVTFPEAFSSAPIVVATLVSTSTSSSVGSITLAIGETTSEYVDLNIFNDSSSSRSPGARWIAMC